MKLQAFHSALGEDSQIYSSDEEFDTYGLFEKVPEEERDERLIYLNFLRRFREENPDLYNKIRSSVPLRARTGRKDRTRKLSTLTYLKNEKRDAFYYINGKDEMEELTFVEAARLFDAHVTEKGTSLHEKHHEQIYMAVSSFKEGLQKDILSKKSASTMGPNEKRALGLLKAFANGEFGNDEEKELISEAREAISVGRFQQLPREINRLNKKLIELKRVEVYRELMSILKKYPLLENGNDLFEAPQPEQSQHPVLEPKIIISESFKV